MLYPQYQSSNTRYSPCHYVSSAVHPDGQIFVTAANFPYKNTYAFSVEDGWAQQGKWKLPFSGRGHFDPELNAWVGICGYYRGFGHLCACDLVLPKTCRDHWKLGKEKLFSGVPGERHLGAKLLYMGGGSRICLVECVYIEHKGFDDDRLYEKLLCLRYEYLLRVTTFSLKYDDNRDLTVGNSRRVRYYTAPESATRSTLKDPVAFWM
ncbi:hypothetical protein HU200_017521 [Digitaria exilis]|uniref:Uncharacterized protein n=1 Tax=Digitaria exilis TaxID=1010633 RepID=A0A835F5U9_9POAL|nr:hypothetical protein HU200_017521 [Digitaria exilis]